MEMDAASRTGVERHPRDHRRRALLPGGLGAVTRSTSSTKCTCCPAAFNALLKTLEEPPAHVKFLFATTEIRKVPVTVLSRCQRFDLKPDRAADADRQHFTKVASRGNGATVQRTAPLAIIAARRRGIRARWRSRSWTRPSRMPIWTAQGTVTAAVRDMLGLADRARMRRPDGPHRCRRSQARP
jgi:DNA polymerase-3 subunit gamma/tau